MNERRLDTEKGSKIMKLVDTEAGLSSPTYHVKMTSDTVAKT